MMLRFTSSRLFQSGILMKFEMRALSCCVAKNLTLCQVPKPFHCNSLRMNSSLSNETDVNSVVIYNGKLERPLIRVKLFSIATSVMGLVFQPVLFSQASSLPVLIATCSVAGFFTFVTPLLLHQVAKRYVYRITYNNDTDVYVAHMKSFFLIEKQIQIKPGEAKVPEFGGMFTSMVVKGIPMMVEMDGFEKEHLIRLLGYDKPLNLEHDRLLSYKKEGEEPKSTESDQEQLDSKVQKRTSHRL